MRISELRPCDACGEPVGISFLRVRVENLLVEVRKVQRHAAMGLFFNGSRLLANMFCDDECTKIASTRDAVLCWNCLDKCSPLAALMEKPEQKEAKP